MANPTRVPVTVLTGFLGSGKTTLLNRILSEQHGRRIAVIENEFGEVGVDHQIVIGAEEEIFETANGCICCTVRGDLIRILNQLVKRRDKFDYVIVETTGLADPGPVAQTFFIDDELREHFQLDAIVTLVDAKHAERQLEEVRAASEQIAFADVVLLNKTDLVSEKDLARVEQRIRAINRTAQVFRTQSAKLPIDRVLDVGAFDLDRALAVDKTFLEPEYPFEWAGVFQLGAGRVRILTGTAGAHEHHHHHHEHHHGDCAHHEHDDHAGAHGHDQERQEHADAQAHGTEAQAHGNDEAGAEGVIRVPSHEHAHAHGDAEVAHGHLHHAGMNITFIRVAAASADELNRQIEPAMRAFAETPIDVPCGGEIEAGANLFCLEVGHEDAQFTLVVNEPGAYAVFCEHVPAEFALRFEGLKAAAQRQFASHHHHDEQITSIGIADPRALDGRKLDEWLNYLMQSQGQDIFRMKGVLNLLGEDRRYVFHGVHMMFDGKLERPWGSTPRHNSLVFIGRKLDRKEIEAGFESCVA
jgi:G3E family GTPase